MGLLEREKGEKGVEREGREWISKKIYRSRARGEIREVIWIEGMGLR